MGKAWTHRYLEAGLLGVLVCALAGCIVPARDALKETTWPAMDGPSARGADPATRGKLIKPVIPPDSAEDSAKMVSVPRQIPDQPDPADVPNRTEYGGKLPSHEPQISEAGPSAQAHPESTLPRAAAVRDPVPIPRPPEPVTLAKPTAQPASVQDAAPVVPPTTASSSSSTGPRKQSEVSEVPGMRTGTEPPPLSTQGGPKEVPREWEDQRIKGAAQQLAKQSAGVKKGKVCYSVKNDEWWVILYQDSADAYDVKQFVWNREQERLEPFLVVTRIAKSRLEDHLNGSEHGRTCEVLDLGQ
ncbi:MAG: hypothetical protein HY914_09435 [Desulfomonile tiedjei]|nr:hypothetical protein [Desulfomonile tiedjei]